MTGCALIFEGRIDRSAKDVIGAHMVSTDEWLASDFEALGPVDVEKSVNDTAFVARLHCAGAYGMPASHDVLAAPQVRHQETST